VLEGRSIELWDCAIFTARSQAVFASFFGEASPQ
jgi:hypothetical protein